MQYGKGVKKVYYLVQNIDRNGKIRDSVNRTSDEAEAHS